MLELIGLQRDGVLLGEAAEIGDVGHAGRADQIG